MGRVVSFRDLGVTIDQKLLFQNHVEILIGACNSVMGFIKLTVGRKFATDTIRVLFNSLVRSKLLFGIAIWYPQTKLFRDQIEGVQNRFTMMALNEWPKANVNNYKIRPYVERCDDLNLDTIYNRYAVACCTLIVDLVTGRLKSEYLLSKIKWNTNRQTRGSNMLLIPTFKVDYLRNQSFWSAVKQFNENKIEFVNSTSRGNYVKQLKNKQITM